MPNENLQIIGSTGLKQFGGVVSEEIMAKLRGPAGIKYYREMADNSSTIGAIRYVITALTRQCRWEIVPAEESPPAVEQQAFVEQCLSDLDITFSDFLAETLSFLDYGFSIFEIVYKLRKGQSRDPSTNSKYSDGKFGWRTFGIRAQDTVANWEFAEDGTITGFKQQDPVSAKSVFIPADRLMLFRTETTKNNPEGRSIYRNAVMDWYYLKKICEIEAIGIERDLCGLPVMEVPPQLLHPQASSEDKALLTSLQKMLMQLKNDERAYAIVPSERDPDDRPTGYKLKLLATGGSRQINLAEATGSFALASSQTNLFSVALGSFLDTIADTFNRCAIARLMQLNSVSPELWPSLTHGDIETPSLSEVGAYVQSLAAAGQLPITEPALQRKLLEIADLPVPAEE
jgi:hypothetical protein